MCVRLDPRKARVTTVVIPPLAADRTALPSGPWVQIDAELLA